MSDITYRRNGVAARVPFEEVNKVRESFGMELLEEKKRICLGSGCGNSFLSEGSHNKMCWRCRGKKDDGLI